MKTITLPNINYRYEKNKISNLLMETLSEYKYNYGHNNQKNLLLLKYLYENKRDVFETITDEIIDYINDILSNDSMKKVETIYDYKKLYNDIKNAEISSFFEPFLSNGEQKILDLSLDLIDRIKNDMQDIDVGYLNYTKRLENFEKEKKLNRVHTDELWDIGLNYEENRIVRNINKIIKENIFNKFLEKFPKTQTTKLDKTDYVKNLKNFITIIEKECSIILNNCYNIKNCKTYEKIDWLFNAIQNNNLKLNIFNSLNLYSLLKKHYKIKLFTIQDFIELEQFDENNILVESDMLDENDMSGTTSFIYCTPKEVKNGDTLSCYISWLRENSWGDDNYKEIEEFEKELKDSYTDDIYKLANLIKEYCSNEWYNLTINTISNDN